MAEFSGIQTTTICASPFGDPWLSGIKIIEGRDLEIVWVAITHPLNMLTNDVTLPSGRGTVFVLIYGNGRHDIFGMAVPYEAVRVEVETYGSEWARIKFLYGVDAYPPPEDDPTPPPEWPSPIYSPYHSPPRILEEVPAINRNIPVPPAPEQQSDEESLLVPPGDFEALLEEVPEVLDIIDLNSPENTN